MQLKYHSWWLTFDLAPDCPEVLLLTPPRSLLRQSQIFVDGRAHETRSLQMY